MEENEKVEHGYVAGTDMQPAFVPPVDGKHILREPAKADPSRAALLTKLGEQIAEARKHWEKRFERMKKNQAFVHGKQWADHTGSNDDNRYVVNLTLSHINQRVSAIYAKNPRVVGKAKSRMWYQVWDGKTESWQAAQQAIEATSQTGMPPPPQVTALLEDIKAGMVKKEQAERIAKTAEKLVQYFFDEPMPRIKRQLKRLVRRVDTCGIGYVKLGYQRAYEANPTISQAIADCSTKIEELERLLADRAEGQIHDGDAELETLRLSLEDLQSQEYVMVREGLSFTFPKSWQIIPDKGCTNVATFENCKLLTEEWYLTPEEVKRYYNVDLGSRYSKYSKGGRPNDTEGSFACVWIAYDLVNHLCYHICDGYPDFLKEPGAPDLTLEQFHPIFALTFNELEDDEDPFPPSEVELIRHAVMEVNRARDEFVQQRIANRPGYITADGTFGEGDATKMATHQNSEVLQLSGVPPGTDIRTVLMAKPVMPVDPNIYSDDAFFADIQRQRQTQQANFGGTGGDTATEATISEASRVSGIQSNIDDLDDFLTDLVRASGQTLLLEMDPLTAKKLVGDGAMWPSLSREEWAQEVMLDLKAGSTGRPNKSLKIANMERLMPFALQTGEISPKWLAGQIVREMDDTVDEDEAMLSGAMPIIALARMTQPVMGDPGQAPAAQGGQGVLNGPAPAQADSHGQGQMAGGAVMQTGQSAPAAFSG